MHGYCNYEVYAHTYGCMYACLYTYSFRIIYEQCKWSRDGTLFSVTGSTLITGTSALVILDYTAVLLVGHTSSILLTLIYVQGKWCNEIIL